MVVKIVFSVIIYLVLVFYCIIYIF